MSLGEKLRQARLTAGLSQRQLCGQEITRNMLSQIEHDTAKPSMKTLQYLAGQLGKSVSFFLEEEVLASPNQQIMAQARVCFDRGDAVGAAAALGQYQDGDELYDREKALLWALTYLDLAETAIGEGRGPYARELLEKSRVPTAYCSQDLERRRVLLLGRIRGERLPQALPSVDEDLFLRAAVCLKSGELSRAVHLLEAMEDRSAPRWHLLRGEASLAREEYAQAAEYFHGAEEAFPKETAPKLEICYRELQDYRRAYEYACAQRKR